MRDGIVLGSQAGLLPGEALDDVIKQIKALDMDEIRRSIEAEKQADGEGADTGVEIV